MAGAFAIVVGFLMMVSGFTMHKLFRESAERWRPPQTSRLPELEMHEKMDFIYINDRDDEHDLHN